MNPIRKPVRPGRGDQNPRRAPIWQQEPRTLLGALPRPVDAPPGTGPGEPRDAGAAAPDDVNGGTSATKDTTHIYGPYLKAVPSLPVGTNKGLSTVTITGAAGTGAFGWYYDGTSVYANDPATDVDVKNVAYNSY